MAWTLDFTGDTVEKLDAGGKVAPGWYRAKFLGDTPDTQSGASDFNFDVGNGMKVKRRMWNPQFADDPKRAATSAQHLKSWAVRFGLVTKEEMASGKQVTIDFNRCIGHDFIVEVVEQKDKDKKSTGFVEIDYMGVYSINPPHEKIPNSVRQGFGLPLNPNEKPAKAEKSAGGGASAPPAPAKNMEKAAKDLWG